jgi:hypothetical protein
MQKLNNIFVGSAMKKNSLLINLTLGAEACIVKLFKAIAIPME